MLGIQHRYADICAVMSGGGERQINIMPVNTSIYVESTFELFQS